MTDGFKKLLKIMFVFALLIGGYTYATKTGVMKKFAPKQSVVTSDAFSGGGTEAPGRLTRALRVGFNTWCGFAGGPYANGGFLKTLVGSIFDRLGLKVEFLKNDDFDAGKAAWRQGAIDVWYCTADTFPVDSAGLVKDEPVIVMQTDWSRGGDAIVTINEIKTVADLKGKDIACAIGSPSHTLLLWMLQANQMTMGDIGLLKMKDGIDAASTFKAKKAPAAVVWAPDDQDCIAAVPGSHVLISSKQASKIIADCLYVKKSFLLAHPEDMKAFVQGWLKANAELNTSEAARKKAAAILAAGFNVDEGFCLTGIGNARLCTFGDNQNFFGLNHAYSGMNGQKLYEGMTTVYQKLKLAEDEVPAWRVISDPSIIRSITELKSTADMAEGEKTFAKLDEAQEAKLETVATNRVTINFDSGSSVLNDTARYIIDDKFGPTLQGFSGARVRIEGNTDNVGAAEMNVRLSKMRAQAVASYLTSKYKLDPNRFVVKGNGMSKPVADNTTDEGKAANRRTDFELVK